MLRITVAGTEYSGAKFAAGLDRAELLAFDRGGSLFGFRDARALGSWAAARDAGDRAAAALAAIDEARALAPPAEAEEARLASLRGVEEHVSRREAEAALARAGLTPADGARVFPALHASAGPKLVGAVLLHDDRGYMGDYRVLLPTWHPKMSWYGFNDRAESCLFFPPSAVTLFQHTWFSGKPLLLLWPCLDLGWFRNRISSAIVV